MIIGFLIVLTQLTLLGTAIAVYIRGRKILNHVEGQIQLEEAHMVTREDYVTPTWREKELWAERDRGNLHTTWSLALSLSCAALGVIMWLV